jgi:hypothetical protein
VAEDGAIGHGGGGEGKAAGALPGQSIPVRSPGG